jgi:predicted membrane-bound mannosyltransferase
MNKKSTPSSPLREATDAAAPTVTQARRLEWSVLLAICLLGLGLRLWRFDKLSIEHFDEGVYAGNLYSVLDQNCYPQRHLYAPPLFPLLCEFAIGIGGTPDAAIWVNLLLGTLTIPLVWCVARDRFGLVAAIVSSVLCATSDYHIFEIGPHGHFARFLAVAGGLAGKSGNAVGPWAHTRGRGDLREPRMVE